MRVEDAIVQKLSAVPEVESLYVINRGSVVRVFAVIDQEVDDVFDAIYDRESSIMRRFSDVSFDFNILARRGRPIDQLVGSETPIWGRSSQACPTNANI